MDLKNETRKEEMDEDFDFDWDDIPYYDLTFAKGIFEIVNSLIDRNHINENFKSKSSLKYHFEKYCLGNGNKASETSHVYYDFKEINDYKEHASRIISNLNNPNTLIISSLGNKELIKEIEKTVMNNPEVIGIHDMIVFSYSIYNFNNRITTHNPTTHNKDPCP